MNKTWTDEDLIYIIGEVYSLAELCRRLNLVPMGGNYSTLKRHITRLKLDTSHFTGQAWNHANWSDKPSGKLAIRRKLLRERGRVCERCNLSEWNGLPIPLEMDHIDGDPYNNEECNLILLCCNCHALTPTWRNRTR